MKQTIWIFGGLTLGILLLFQLNKFSLLQSNIASEWLIALSGGLFILIGFLLSKYLRKNPAREKTTEQRDEKRFKQTGLSEREYEILQLIARGHSNQEIANRLFISENTVKTHISRIFQKLNARRRTQAIQIARDLNII